MSQGSFSCDYTELIPVLKEGIAVWNHPSTKDSMGFVILGKNSVELIFALWNLMYRQEYACISVLEHFHLRESLPW